MAKKHLEGKGELLYDLKNDILMFKVKDRDYKFSIEFQNFTVDIDKEDFVTGIRIFDASKVIGVDKFFLKSIVKTDFKAQIENNVVTVSIQFVSKVRNKLLSLFGQKERFKQQIITPIKHNINDSVAECVA